MLSPALTGVIFYAVMVCIVMIFLYSLTRNFNRNLPKGNENHYAAFGKPCLYLDEQKQIAINVAMLKTVYIQNAEIFTELINGDTYLIKKCSETEDPKLELARIINEINERVL